MGNAVTPEQYAAIRAGTFEDLYIGDYWTIGGIDYRIAAFDYYLNSGDTRCTTHHAVIAPDTCLYITSMNSTNTTNGGYVGSAMHTANLEQAKTTIKGAFSGHVLKHRIYLAIKRPFSDTDREMLLRNCKTLRDKAMMEFLYSTAVRVSELKNLNIEDIRWSSKDLIVYGKGGKERTVYLNERTNLYLQEYLQSRTDNNPALFVGTRKPYNRLTKAGIEDMIRRTGRRAGVEKAHPHRFRGTALTNALNRGMPLQEASILAGHAKTETTMLYCTVDQESVKYHHKKYLSA